MDKRVTFMMNSRRSVVASNRHSFGLLFASAVPEVRDQTSETRGQKSDIRLISFFATLVLALTLTGVLHAAPASTVPGRILVKPRDGINESDLQQLFAAHGAKQHAVINQINVRVLNVPEAASASVLGALQHNPNIEFGELDFVAKADAVPNDPYYVYNYQWHLSKIAAPSAWDVTTGSTSVIIAVLDTGIDSTHPDIAAKLILGWNFYDNNSDTTEVYAHGTAVAGTAAAISNNGTGVASIAWGCKIMPIRVSDTNGYANSSVIASGLTYAADHGARVANISFGVSDSSTVASAAQYFQSKGGVVTVSAGNEGTFNSTADNPYVLTVSATDSNDALASFSNTGNNVDLAAPGVSIMTAGGGGLYVSGTGTSFSAPIVAGVAALVISVNPSLTAAQVQNILKQSADDLGASGWDPSFGYGRINAYKAVIAAQSGEPADTIQPTTMVTTPSADSTVSGVVSVGIIGTDNVGVTKVEWYLNGTLISSSASASATFAWNTATYSNGSWILQARAYDAAGNIGTSAINVTVQNTVPDTTAPTATITAPASGSTVSGVVSVNVSATDNVSVTKVEWYLNGTMAGTSATASAAFTWNTTGYPNGPCNLQAKAYDAAGNVGVSTTLNVTVQNAVADVSPPATQITSPTNGNTVSGKSTKVYATANDNVGVTKVDLMIDGKFYSTSTSAAPVFSWNTSKLSRGQHTLQSVAYDAAGNKGSSTVVTVNK
jgi:hypothetical protein